MRRLAEECAVEHPLLTRTMNRIARPGFVSVVALVCASAVGATGLTQGQLEAAERVFVGTANCDANQQIILAAVAGQPGHFTLTHKKATVTLVTQETTSGAVRLADAKSGLVWIQIPAKSMLMNTKLGRRLADACITPEQALASTTPEPAPPGATPGPVPEPAPPDPVPEPAPPVHTTEPAPPSKVE